MHVLILSSRCTKEQRNGLTALRGYLETHGDLCEALDWYSFLSDSVSRINARSRKLVRHHIQELLLAALAVALVLGSAIHLDSSCCQHILQNQGIVYPQKQLHVNNVR